MSYEEKLQHARDIGFGIIKDNKRARVSKKVFGKDFSSIERDVQAVDSKEKKAKSQLEEVKTDRARLQREVDVMNRKKHNGRLALFLQEVYRTDPLFAARVDQLDQPNEEVQHLLHNGTCIVCRAKSVSVTCTPCGDRVLCRECAARSSFKKCPVCHTSCSLVPDKIYNFGTSSTSTSVSTYVSSPF